MVSSAQSIISSRGFHGEMRRRLQRLRAFMQINLGHAGGRDARCASYISAHAAAGARSIVAGSGVLCRRPLGVLRRFGVAAPRVVVSSVLLQRRAANERSVLNSRDVRDALQNPQMAMRRNGAASLCAFDSSGVTPLGIFLGLGFEPAGERDGQPATCMGDLCDGVACSLRRRQYEPVV